MGAVVPRFLNTGNWWPGGGEPGWGAGEFGHEVAIWWPSSHHRWTVTEAVPFGSSQYPVSTELGAGSRGAKWVCVCV